MIPIKILNSSLAELATIAAASSALRTEKINADNSLNFSIRIADASSAYINSINMVGLGTDYFDIAYYKKEQQGDGRLMVSVECEHVSYRLNNAAYNKDFYRKIDTPTNILTDLLDGTGFTVGTVDFATETTFDSALYGAAAGNQMSRRSLVMQFANHLGGELEFDGFEISLLAQRGSATPKALTVGKDVTVLSEAVNKRELDEDGNPIVVYTVGVYKGADFDLGDVVTLSYAALGISASLRIVSKSYDPYNPNSVTIEVGNYTKTIADAMYSLQAGKASIRYVDALQAATSALNGLISNSLGYYTTIVTDPDTGAMITYIHDASTLAASVVIYVMTESGLAWTKTGWNGGSPVWSYGLTSDGNALLNILVVNGINADWINAGTFNADLILVGAQTLTNALAGLQASIAAVSGGGTNFIQNSAFGTYDAPSLYWWYLGLTWQLLEKRIDTWTEFESNIATWTAFEAYTW